MIDRLDHLVLTVADIDSTKAFYCDLLGMKYETFGHGRQALKFGQSKINIHIKGNEFEPKAHVALPGTADLCFIITGSLEDMMGRLEQAGIPIETGPADRTGASGPIRSVYVRDPDKNLIELSVYPDQVPSA
jgi:catechol 2,3-dioxygenase-like lactoylglutathione lyase family enzyme